jgi:hypothetical protein
MDCSGSSDGQIKRTKIVLRATALFLFASFSFRVIFIMGVPDPNADSGWHRSGPRGVKGVINFARKVSDVVTDVSMALQNLGDVPGMGWRR